MSDSTIAAPEHSSGGRRSGGRAGRAAMRASHVIERVPYLTRTLKPFEVASDETLALIEYTADTVHSEGTLDEYRREFLFDPQTSGGLLISIPADRVDELVKTLLANGTLVAAVIGEVVPRRDRALWVK